IPAYQDYTIRSQLTEGLNLAAALKAAVTESFPSTGSFPSSKADLNYGDLSGKYTSAVTIAAHGTIEVLLGGESSAKISGKKLLLTPFLTSNSDVVWRCSSSEIPAPYLPATCRSEDSFWASLVSAAVFDKCS